MMQVFNHLWKRLIQDKITFPNENLFAMDTHVRKSFYKQIPYKTSKSLYAVCNRQFWYGVLVPEIPPNPLKIPTVHPDLGVEK